MGSHSVVVKKNFLHSLGLSIASGNLPCQVVAGLNVGYGVDQNFLLDGLYLFEPDQMRCVKLGSSAKECF